LVNAYRFLECISQESPTTSPTLSAMPSIAPTILSVPTSKPTYSISPTPNEIHFRIEIIPDNYAHETSWTLKNTDESINDECILDEETSSGGVGTYNFMLCDNANYEWSIYDAWGDGICCDFGIGNFKLFLNDVLIFEGGEFGDVLKYQFSTSSDILSSNPTLKPSSSAPSMNPTLKPTLNIENTIAPTYLNLDDWKDINIDLLSPDSLGTAIVVNFKYDSIASNTDFSIEYSIDNNEFKYPNSNHITTLMPFWDNVYYYVLRSNDIVCDSIIQVRIGIVLSPTEVSNKILSEQIRVECFNPTSVPTSGPTSTPTIYPTNSPSSVPSRLPTIVPTIYPTNSPSSVPSRLPTIVPTTSPTEYGNVPLCELTNDMNILSGNFVFEKGNNSECNLKSNNNVISSAYATNYYIQNGEISANIYSENSIKRDYGLILRIQDLDSDFQWMPRTGYHCQISTGINDKNNSKLIISVIENGDDDHSSSIQIIKKSSEFTLNPNINYQIKASAIDNVIQCGISLNDNVISQIEVTDNTYSEGYYSTWNYKDDYGSHIWNSLVIKNVD